MQVIERHCSVAWIRGGNVADKERTLQNIYATTDLDAAADIDIVIEAATENLR